MNKAIRALASVAEKNTRAIIGLMSGTSLDGLDIALCSISGSGGNTRISVPHFETIAYDESFREALQNICFKENVSLPALVALHQKVGRIHGEFVNAFLRARNINPSDVDLIASHGQTVFHAPSLPATLQLGDADHIAALTGIMTVSDFRQKHIAAGGQGAPLAAYGDLLLFAVPGRNTVLLNIGGIANFSFINAAGKLFCSDTGPGNTLMDRFVARHFAGLQFDDAGTIAGGGTLNHALLRALLDDDFFTAALPKTTGPEYFNAEYLNSALKKSAAAQASPADIVATLNKFTATHIGEALRKLTGEAAFDIYVSGGGAHNRVLMQNLESEFPAADFKQTAEKNIPPDAKEAVLFAVLANECVAGDAEYFSGRGENMPPVLMGKISFPF